MSFSQGTDISLIQTRTNIWHFCAYTKRCVLSGNARLRLRTKCGHQPRRTQEPFLAIVRWTCSAMQSSTTKCLLQNTLKTLRWTEEDLVIKCKGVNWSFLVGPAHHCLTLLAAAFLHLSPTPSPRWPVSTDHHNRSSAGTSQEIMYVYFYLIISMYLFHQEE